MRPTLLLWLSAGLLCAGGGCAGYKLGPSNNLLARSQSIQINSFQNNTAEPRLSAAVASALRRSLQQDGTYRLDTRDNGDIVVSGILTRYERSEVSVQPEDVMTPRDYEVSISADVTAVERATGRVLLQRQVVGRTAVRVVPDMVSAERQAVPLMAADLAQRLADLLVDGDW